LFRAAQFRENGMASPRPIGEILPADAFAPGTSVLLTGATSGTVGDLPRRLLAAHAGPKTGGVLVTTRGAASELAGTVATALDAFPEELAALVDCTPREGLGTATPGDLVWQVPSPTAFGAIGEAVERSLAALAERGAEDGYLLFDTLSTPLMTADPEVVARFAHGVIRAVATADAVGLFPVYTNTTKERDVERLKHLFDAQIEVRQRGGERMVRSRGLAGGPAEWVAVATEL